MRFGRTALALVSFAYSSSSATAWTTTRYVARHRLTAAALFSTTTEVQGEAATESFRLKFKNDSGSVISPWHDIPLKDGDNYNMVVEIPKMTKAKMEVATKETNNPIAQDIKKGKLRDYHGPIFWNYGCLPQTWEDPNVKHPELGCFGDDDPIDVVEIGGESLAMGSVTPVKPLGVLAMIDDGELDWKVLAVSVSDPLAKKYNDIDVSFYILSPFENVVLILKIHFWLEEMLILFSPFIFAGCPRGCEGWYSRMVPLVQNP